MTTPTNSGTNAGGQGNPGAGNAGAAPTPGQVFPRGNSGGSGQQGGQQQQQGTQQQGGQQSGSGDGGGLTPEEFLGSLLGDNTGQQGGQQSGGQQTGRTQAPDLSQLPEDVQQYIAGLSGRGTELQRRARDLEKERNKGNAAIRKLQEIEDAQKSEAEKAVAAQRRAEEAAAESEAKVHRLLAAASHDISPDMIDFLGSGSENEINDRAETLASAIKAEAAKLVQSMIGDGTLPQQGQNGQQGQRYGSRRPVETLRPGGAPASGNGGQTAEDAFKNILANVRR